MILATNRVGCNFIETLHRTLNSLIGTQENAYAMHAKMIFPHLMLCKTKPRSDGSNSKTIARRLKQWHKSKLDNFFNNGKALQMRLAKSEKKKVETEALQFNKLMSTGKISSAFAKLTDTAKGVLSLEKTVKDQFVERILIENHLPRYTQTATI